MEKTLRRPGSLMRRLRMEAALCSRWETNRTRHGAALLPRPHPLCRRQEEISTLQCWEGVKGDRSEDADNVTPQTAFAWLHWRNDEPPRYAGYRADIGE